MITEMEMAELLSAEIPAIKNDLRKVDDVKSPYKLARCLVNFTCSKLQKSEYRTMRKCLKVAERILQEGDRGARNAIEQVFMSALRTAISKHKELITQLPPLLQEEYRMQTEPTLH